MLWLGKHALPLHRSELRARPDTETRLPPPWPPPPRCPAPTGWPPGQRTSSTSVNSRPHQLLLAKTKAISVAWHSAASTMVVCAARCALCGRPAPSALLTRTETALPRPSGNMYIAAAGGRQGVRFGEQGSPAPKQKVTQCHASN